MFDSIDLIDCKAGLLEAVIRLKKPHNKIKTKFNQSVFIFNLKTIFTECVCVCVC